MASSEGSLFKGFVLGGFFGLAAGMLLAPKSGEAMRKELIDEGDDLLDKAKDELEKIKTDLGDLRDKINKTIEHGKNVFDQAESTEERDFDAAISDDDAPKKKTSKKKSSTKKTDDA